MGSSGLTSDIDLITTVAIFIWMTRATFYVMNSWQRVGMLILRCFQISGSSLGEEGVCESTLAELTAVLRTREKYSSDPVLNSDVKQLISVTGHWIDDCPNTTPSLRHPDHLISLLEVADLIFGHTDMYWSSSLFYRSHRSVSYYSNMA